jgi:anti-anti-sigma factor
MTIRQRTRDNVTIFDIQGKIVGEESLALKRHLDAFIEGYEGAVCIVLNLADAPFLDSAGLGAVVLAHQRASERGGRVAVLAPVAHVRRLLTVARLTQMIPVYDDEDSAVSSVQNDENPTHP